MLKTVSLALLAGLGLSQAPQANAAEHFYDAMALAIEHFNPNHDKDIVAWGPEHRFMYDLLKAVDEQVPAVAGFTRLGDLQYGNNPFQSLARNIFIPKGDVKTKQFADALSAAVKKVTAGCPYQKKTTVEETNYNSRSVTQTESVTWSLDGSYSKKCNDQALAQEIVARGVNQITLEAGSLGYGDSVTVKFSQGINTYRDMQYVKNQLAQIPEISQIVAELPNPDITGRTAIGRSQNIGYAGSGEHTVADAVTLKYWKGWGDCPAGCIAHHDWTVEVQPTKVGANQYQFKATVVAESGNPLP